MSGFISAAISTFVNNPQLGIGWLLAIYLLVRLHQVTDRQHKAAVEATKALVAVKTFLITKFGGGLE